MFLDDTHECVDGSVRVGMAAILVDPSDRTPAFDQADSCSVSLHDASAVVVTGANRGLGLELARATRARRRGVGGLPPTRRGGRAAPPSPTTCCSSTSLPPPPSNASPPPSARPVDVLINNAGVDARALGVADDERDVLQLGEAHFLDEIRINALGPMLLARALLDRCGGAARPRIVNMSSTVGSMVVAATVGRDVGYVVSKAALNLITVKLAGRLRDDGVIVVAIHPGLLRTALGRPVAT